jgi:hypothetical protein
MYSRKEVTRRKISEYVIKEREEIETNEGHRLMID